MFNATMFRQNEQAPQFTYHDRPRQGTVEAVGDSAVVLRHTNEQTNEVYYRTYRYEKMQRVG